MLQSQSAKRVLKRRIEQQRSLVTIAQLALEDVSTEALMQHTAQALAATLHAPIVSLLEHRALDGMLILRAGVGWPVEMMGAIYCPLADSVLARYTIDTEMPLLIEDLPSDSRFPVSPRLTTLGVRAGVSVVLRAQGRIYGVLGAFATEPRDFSEDDASFVQSIAFMLSGALTRRADAETLASQKGRLQGILDTALDSIITIDQQGVIESVNPMAETMFGYPPGKLIGQNITVLMPEQFHTPHSTALASYLATGKSRIIGTMQEMTGLKSDGTEFPIELSVGEIRTEREHLFIGTIRDLTERKITEDQLRQAQKMEAVGQLTGGIAHDFNNLLTVVLGNAEMLAEEIPANTAQHQMMESVIKAAERGAELTQRLLAFSRRQSLQPEDIDAEALILETTQLLRRTLGEHITIETGCDTGLWHAMADPTQLQTALINLALNARDAMPGGGTLRIEAANRTVEPGRQNYSGGGEARPGGYVMIAVSDTGTGIPADVLPRIYEPFYTTKEVGKGSGLGLSMVYGFVRQTGGFILLDSQVDHGTRVELYLPQAAKTKVPAAAAAQESYPLLAPPDAHILLVEDDPLVSAYLTAALRDAGYQLTVAGNAQDALAHLAGQEAHSFDLLLTDIVMPGGMDGHALAKIAATLRPDIAILLSTGYSDALSGGEAADLAWPLLQKPYNRATLKNAVRNVLNNRPRQPSPQAEAPIIRGNEE
ncbi:MAG: PAS domain S-box protein [Alphaproteobacteria bacterium]|nr:PAS domain S-box protein [Alphaproteobacteria bacterium]MBU0796237.1 PAS domain S-box protein [Alphaproteobacteria bacterium]MBU0885724.1 PAS domain S-box protein [Alphaproteobacteria bacterium]MBU1813122.1 PAS domain S-box protein [Alphaproteobacteria bacterium]MBU2091873.1 PAS domain S-box protein [Alphaproteobacteria bacterium]